MFPVRIGCADVEASFLPVLGVKPVIGRNFTREEDSDGGPDVAIISTELWQSRFASDRNILGRTLPIDGIDTQIVGVLPARFELPTLAPAGVLLPQRLKRDSQRQRLVRAIGRLPASISPNAAAAQLGPLFARFVESTPTDFRDAAKMRFRVESLRDQQTRDYRVTAWTLLAAVVAVLLIACANVSSLLLTQAAGRRRELAVRAALGASRGQLMRQRVTEALLLGIAAGVAGYSLAFVLVKTAVSMSPEGMLRLREANLDLRVFCFAAVVSMAAGVIVGLVSSLDKPQLEQLTGGRVAGSRSKHVQRAFIAAQVAAVVVLLTCSGMLLASLANMQNAPLGMQPERVLTVSLTLNPNRYTSSEKQIAFFNELEERLRGIPGVSAAAITDTLPPGGDPRSRPLKAMAHGEKISGLVIWRYVTPGYFSALGIPLVRGRGFTEADRRSGVQPVILNQAMASAVFGDQEPLGQSIGRKNAVEDEFVVVGVAADVRNDTFASRVQPEFYAVRKHSPAGVYTNQQPPHGWRRATVLVRSSSDEGITAKLVREEVHKLDPALPLEIGSMQAHLATFLRRPRFTSSVLTVFAAMGLLLAALGLYAHVSYAVAGRTREIGLRMAVGARAATVVRMVLRQSLAPVSIGATLGAVLAVMSGRLLRGMLFGVPERDPRLILAAVSVLAGVAVFAAWLPARRAARVDPTLALRHE